MKGKENWSETNSFPSSVSWEWLSYGRVFKAKQEKDYLSQTGTTKIINDC